MYNNTYYLEKTSNGVNSVTIESKLFQNRVLQLIGEIDTENVNQTISQILVLASDSDEAITILINSPGGEIQAGLALIDVIKSVSCIVKTVVIGMAASMAAVIAAAGTPGHRYISMNSRMMIHEPIIQNGVGGSCSSVQATAKAILERKIMMNELLSSLTGKPIDEIEIATSYDNYLSSSESVNFGLADKQIAGSDLFDIMKGVKPCM